jgi:hypothetical protein
MYTPGLTVTPLIVVVVVVTINGITGVIPGPLGLAIENRSARIIKSLNGVAVFDVLAKPKPDT